MKNACRTVALVFFMSLASSGALFAQSDLGRISGFVKDPSGATVANAKVTVQNKTGVERQTTTNESGYYIITPEHEQQARSKRGSRHRCDSDRGHRKPYGPSLGIGGPASDRVGIRAKTDHPRAD